MHNKNYKLKTNIQTNPNGITCKTPIGKTNQNKTFQRIEIGWKSQTCFVCISISAPFINFMRPISYERPNTSTQIQNNNSNSQMQSQIKKPNLKVQMGKKKNISWIYNFYHKPKSNKRKNTKRNKKEKTKRTRK